MIVVDTSVWIDHLRHRLDAVERLLKRKQVLAHPFIIGEIALGPMPRYDLVIQSLSELPQAMTATPEEVLHFIRKHHLQGAGIGYVDTHLLASTLLTPEARLWTRDKRLAASARTLGINHIE